MSTSQQLFRRLLSFAVSFIALTICLPFLPLIILAVRLSSPAPFFSARRGWTARRLFTAYKFAPCGRTLKRKERVAPRTTSRHLDWQVFAKYRLDEIPQLWNVLRGDMAFVVPPGAPGIRAMAQPEIPFYDLRHMIRQGLRLAQVRYRYGASLEETKHKLEYDLYYVKHQSIGLDLLIMFETIKTIILRRARSEDCLLAVDDRHPLHLPGISV